MLATVDIRLIYVGDRIRKISEATVAGLTESIGDVGLLNPITVRPRKVIVDYNTVDGYALVAGAHRLEAVRRLGLTEVAVQVLNISELEATIAECDENLRGTSLSASDRALFVRRRKDAYEALHPETRNGVIGATARHAPAKLADASFTADTAARTGQSERVVQRDAERGEKVAEEAIELIKGTKLDTGVYLDKIKKLEPVDQIVAVKRDLASIDEQKERAARTSLAPPDPAIADAKKTNEAIAFRDADDFANWLMTRLDLAELPTLISWLEGTKPKQTIAALRRLSA